MVCTLVSCFIIHCETDRGRVSSTGWFAPSDTRAWTLLATRFTSISLQDFAFPSTLWSGALLFQNYLITFDLLSCGLIYPFWFWHAV